MEPNYATEVPFVHPGTCFLVPHALDAAACERLIRAATEQGFAPTALDYPASYRDNDRLVRDDPALAAALFERLRPVLPKRLVDARGAAHRLIGLNARFRFCRYEGGQRFRVHRDGAHAPAEGVRSRLTVQIYLDDAARFVGGRTRFYASRTGPSLGAVVPSRGTAVVFDHDLWHDGEPVSSGRKHVLRTDAIYEREAPPPDAPPTDAPGEAALRGHHGYVYRVIALEDGGLATASRDRTVRVWRRDEAGWACAQVLEGHRGSVHALAEIEPGVLWSGSRDRTVRAHDLRTGSSRLVDEVGAGVLCVAPFGELVAIGATDGTIRLQRRDGARASALAGHRGFVWSLASLGDGMLVSASDDGSVRLWNEVACLDAAWANRGPAHAIVALDSDSVAAGFADGYVVVYAIDRRRGTLAPVDVLHAHDGEVYALAPLGSGHDALLATGGEDDRVRVHRLRDHARLAEHVHEDFVRSIARVGPDRLASASYDGTVRLWRGG